MKNILIALSLMALLSCGKKDKDYRSIANPDEPRSVIVENTVPAGGYTYVEVVEGDESYWIAVASEEFAKGETLYFNSFVEMKEFKSKELDKTFDRILFVDQISRDPDALGVVPQKDANSSPHARNRMDVLIDSIKIQPAPGGLSIAELYGNAQKHNGKEVIVRGQIVKINRDIMDRNWVHIMDGTRVDRSDLTFTTTEDFQLGDTITIQGKVTLDKDFGGGYVYPLIVEEAVSIQ